MKPIQPKKNKFTGIVCSLAILAVIIGVGLMILLKMFDDDSDNIRKISISPTQPWDGHDNSQINTVKSTNAETNQVMKENIESSFENQAEKINLVLLGTMIEPSKSLAIIKNEDTGNKGIYQEGEEILEGIVKKIYADRAIIQIHDKEFTIHMEMISKAGPDEESDAELKRPMTPEEIFKKYPMTNAMLEVMELKSKIDYVGYKENDKAAGVIVTRVEPGSLFEHIGIQPDDVIIDVDGKDIEYYDDAMEIYESIRTTPKGVITVKRNGVPVKLPYARSS